MTEVNSLNDLVKLLGNMQRRLNGRYELWVTINKSSLKVMIMPASRFSQTAKQILFQDIHVDQVAEELEAFVDYANNKITKYDRVSWNQVKKYLDALDYISTREKWAGNSRDANFITKLLSNRKRFPDSDISPKQALYIDKLWRHYASGIGGGIMP